MITYYVLGNNYSVPVSSFSSKKRAFDFAKKRCLKFVRSFSSSTGNYCIFENGVDF